MKGGLVRGMCRALFSFVRVIVLATVAGEGSLHQ